MINSKQELKFYIQADRMMNRGCFKWSLCNRLLHIISPDYIMMYLETLRKAEFYSHTGGISVLLAAFRTEAGFYNSSKCIRLRIGYPALRNHCCWQRKQDRELCCPPHVHLHYCQRERNRGRSLCFNWGADFRRCETG